ncbi:TetR/AcrR family transcriptional regulator [Conexibacter sp. SYSU D00693]|uniref:TetR/AcrR family transcriptional regulator n=1 Tax=Conexibacter sp. SYSU D00693 TaxID=2812560 RepID=UPI00196B253B|nr:TetR/AcrR family transcriptional regulator [Conexibacter sp. SYSU D00693]
MATSPEGTGTADRPLRADAARNRQAVLAAARTLVAKRGLEVGVDEIAQAAGVGKGTLYRRFPTKDALLEALLEDRAAVLHERLAKAVATAPGDPASRLDAAAHAVAATVAEDRGFYDAIRERLSALPAAATVHQRLVDACAPLLAAAQEAGTVRDDVDAEDLVVLLVNASRVPAARRRTTPRLWERHLVLALDALRPGGRALPPG